MFTKATLFAALLAGASANTPPSYGGSEQPKGYDYPVDSSSYPAEPTHDATYPAVYPTESKHAEYPTESKPYVYPTASYPTEEHPTYTKPAEDKPTYPATYPAHEDKPTEPAKPYLPETYSSAKPSKFTKTSDDYVYATLTKTDYVTITKDGKPYVTTTESVYTTYCPESEKTKSVYKPEQPKETYPAEKPKETYPAEKPKVCAILKSTVFISKLPSKCTLFVSKFLSKCTFFVPKLRSKCTPSFRSFNRSASFEASVVLLTDRFR